MKRSYVAAASVLVLSACGGGEESRPNVLLVVADTLRADKLSCQGGPEGLTPYIDALAAEGARFPEASAHAPWTLPSIASLLTSLHPLEHGAGGRVPRFHALDPDVTTLADQLRERGYRTHAIVNVDFLDPDAFGVTRGFETVDRVSYTNNVEVRAAKATTDAALRWLEEHGDEPYFLLVHYFDPHCVYAPPRTFRERWAAPEDRGTDWTFGTRSQMVALRDGSFDPDETVLERAERLYEGEIAYLDGQVGRLVHGVDTAGGRDETVVVFTADHGEEFLDHGGFEHGHTLYQELLRVPLVVRFPPEVPPVVSPVRARHVDVVPTLCDLLALPVEPQYVGASLLPVLRGEDDRGRAVLAHGNFWGAARSSWTEDGWKLVLHPDGRTELYDLDADPDEREDRSREEPQRVERMRAALESAQEAMAALQRGGPAALTEEHRESLQGLGYGPGR